MTPSKQKLLRTSLVVSLAVLPALAYSAERRAAKRPAAGATGKSVELFEAMKAKDIDVKVIAKDENEARVIVKNNTDQPLNVRLPEAFAVMPVLAQIGGGGGRGGVGGVAGQQAQTTGGGMMGGGMGGGMMGGGMGGMMNVAPEKVAQFKVATVCLEHGKKPPRASLPYELKPIESFTSSAEVKSLLVAFGKGKVGQHAAQAAAWHLSSGLSWDQLAAKRAEEFGNPETRPWFNEQDLREGMAAAHYAIAEAKTNTDAKKSPGETESQNAPREAAKTSSDK